MWVWQRQPSRTRLSLRHSIEYLESHIHHANTLVAALPGDIAGDSVQMKLSFSPFASFLMPLVNWIDCGFFDAFIGYLGIFHVLVYRVYADGMPIATAEERKATLREFYAVIYPMLRQLEGSLVELMDENIERTTGNVSEDVETKSPYNVVAHRDDECGICMEMDCKVVLPICGHSMCVGCFDEWYMRSQSCPFCRRSLKRVKSGDLWVLTSSADVVDATTLTKDNLRRFYSYIDKLPLLVPDDNLLVMYNYLM